MTPAAILDRLGALVAGALGLHVEERHRTTLAEALARRSAQAGVLEAEYVERLAGEPAFARAEHRELARELTVGETYFFRHGEQCNAYADVALAARAAARGDPRGVRVLSVGCASGEEAYTLAILARERFPAADVEVRGIDVNPSAIERAALGRYTAWSLRDVPAAVRAQWFALEGREHVLDAGVRASVTFEERNVLVEDPAFWAPAAFDVVFCRNVLMYLTREAQEAAVRRIEDALAPGGYLFLGHAEPLRGLSNAFTLEHTHGAFYYRKQATRGTAAAFPLAPAARPPLGAIDVASDAGRGWVDGVRRATDRVHALGDAAATASEDAVADRAPSELAAATDLLRAERFADALAVLARLPPAAARAPEALALRAALLAQGGDTAEAERAADELLAVDPLHAGAHYLLALCRENAGDVRAAAAHDRAAAHLDATFAMPRLHLGLLARRAGDREAARRELAQALLLLQREEPARVLLFGGGFHRDGLIALCRAELERLREAR